MVRKSRHSDNLSISSRRRRLLAVIGGTSATTLFAGCLGDDDDDADDEDDTADDPDDTGADDSDDADDEEAHVEFVVGDFWMEPDGTIDFDATFDVGAEITNIGGDPGSQMVEYRIEGDVEAETELELEGFTVGEVVFEGIEAEDFEPGETYEHGIYTEDDEETGEFSIAEPPDPAAFEVASVTPGNRSVLQGDTVEFGATIDNTGDEEGIQDVTLTFDGDEHDSQEITIAGRGSQAVFFEDLATADLDNGEYEYEVATDDDNRTATLTVTDDPLAANLEAHYPLDGDEPTDAAGDRDGEIEGDVETGAEGIVGDAYQFNGGQVDLPEFGIEDSSATISVWINADDLDGQSCIVFWGDDSPQFEVAAQDGNAWVFYWDGSDERGPGGMDLALPVEQWIHYVLVYDNDAGEFIVYIDGEEATTVEDPLEDMGYTGSNNTLGVHPNEGREFFGRLDDVRLYSRALSADNIQALYDMGEE